MAQVDMHFLTLTEEEIIQYQQKADFLHIPLCQILFEENKIEENQYLMLLSKEYDIEYIKDLSELVKNEQSNWKIENEVICSFPLQWLRKNSLVPIFYGEELILAFSDVKAWLLNQEIEFTLGENIVRPILAEKNQIQILINIAFNETSTSNAEDFLQKNDNDEFNFDEDNISDVLDDSNEAPFIRFVNHILAQAIRLGASDIHIEPYRDESRVRFRLDGILYDRHKLDKNYHPAIVSRVKVMAKLNIAEKRLPQDGRITIALGEREVGLRVSTLPTSFGERIVLRLLEKSEKVLSLTELGLNSECLKTMYNFINMPNGIILVTGPTGSGKTTTLYAALQEIASPNRNILTIEDPVEYELEGVGQVQVNSKIGLTFASGLRSLVRQDPDVILIGEIRDTETASIAVQSALTGHLVFSTLHTNDAPSAISRLLDMEVEPFLLASVLRGVIAQRLVRVLCPHCKEPYLPNAEEKQRLGTAISYMDKHLYKEVGCTHCMHTGYKGRIAIYEMMPVTDMIKKLTAEKKDANTIREAALQTGMYSLVQDGMVKVAQGITSLIELARVINV